MILKVEFEEKNKSYDIVIERGVISKAAQELMLDRKVLILTDDGVPRKYVDTVVKACKEPHIFTVPQGEGSKSI